MKYALLICTPVGGTELSPAEIAEDPRFTSVHRGGPQPGHRQGRRPPAPATDATTVRVRDDEVAAHRRAVHRDQGADRRAST